MVYSKRWRIYRDRIIFNHQTMPKLPEQSEEQIEANICEFLMLKGASLDKIVME
jgi:hypothetical protein